MLFTEPFQDSLIHSAFITSQNCQAAIKKEVKTSKEEKSGLGRLKSTLGRHILQTPQSNSLRLLAASPIAGMEFSTLAAEVPAGASLRQQRNIPWTRGYPGPALKPACP